MKKDMGGVRKKVMLLGDSIRRSYQPHVARLLGDRARVLGPADNCRYTLYTLSSLDRWLEELGKPEIVHWNNGLHDAGHDPKRSPAQIPLDMYLDNLGFILERLRQETPRIIWATSTPVHPRREMDAARWWWDNDEIERYNEGARRMMGKEGVPVNDLHAIISAHPDEYFAEDRLHLSAAGQMACARAVVRYVEDFLDS